VPGTAAVGVAFPPEAPVAAISVAAISARLDEARRGEVAVALHRHAQALSRLLAAAPGGAREDRPARPR
jgi:DNA-binding IclR family transcriptional regulator